MLWRGLHAALLLPLFCLEGRESEEEGRADGSCLSGSQKTATQIKQQSQGKKNKNKKIK